MTHIQNQIARRALYSLLRLNWLHDPSMSAEQWQIEDYSVIPTSTLFNRLTLFQIQLDAQAFHAYAEECDSPEDFADFLTDDRDYLPDQEDQIYLIVFELWLRLLPERVTLSTLCHQIDKEITLFNQGDFYNARNLQDLISQLIQLLKNSMDEGIPPAKLLSSVSQYFANDFSSFLYDYISDQIDNEMLAYANDLVEDFAPFLKNDRWFELIKLRINNQSPQKRIAQIFESNLISDDLEFNLELLSLLVKFGDPASFKKALKATIPLMRREEDFQDLIQIGMDFYHRLDQELQEAELLNLLNQRKEIPLSREISPSDTGIPLFKKIFSITS